MTQHILVVDDEATIRTVIRDGLELNGYQVDTVPNPDQALLNLENKSYDLALVDLKMPGLMDGLQLLAEIHRRWSRTITIVLTGFASLESAITALQSGASDYLRKPVEIGEIVQSVRRNLTAPSPKRPRIAPGESKTQHIASRLEPGRFFYSPRLFIDRVKRLVTLDNHVLQLTPIEFTFLDLLVSHAGSVVSTAELLKTAQGYEIFEADARPIVRVHIQHLRQKLQDNADTPAFILNVRGLGYRYVGQVLNDS
jgi:DNA-binding response OmpR family regulator